MAKPTFWKSFFDLEEPYRTFRRYFFIASALLLLLVCTHNFVRSNERFRALTIVAEFSIGIFASFAAAALFEIFSATSRQWQNNLDSYRFGAMFGCGSEKRVAILLP